MQGLARIVAAREWVLLSAKARQVRLEEVYKTYMTFSRFWLTPHAGGLARIVAARE